MNQNEIIKIYDDLVQRIIGQKEVRTDRNIDGEKIEVHFVDDYFIKLCVSEHYIEFSISEGAKKKLAFQASYIMRSNEFSFRNIEDEPCFTQKLKETALLIQLGAIHIKPRKSILIGNLVKAKTWPNHTP